MVKPSTSPTQTPQKAQMVLDRILLREQTVLMLLPSIPRSHSLSLIGPSSIARAMTMHPNASHWNSQGMISQALIPLKLRHSFSLFTDSEGQNPIPASAISNSISPNGRELTIAIDPDIIANAGVTNGQTLYLAYTDPSEGSDGTTPTTLQGSNNYDVASFNTSFTFTLPDRPVFNSASYDDASKRITLEFTGDDIAGFNPSEIRLFSLFTDSEGQNPIPASAISNSISPNGRELTIAIDPDIIANAGVTNGQTLYLAYTDPSEGSDGTTPTTLQGSNNYDVASFNTSFTFTLPDRPVFNSASYDDASKRITLEFTGDDIAGFNPSEIRHSFSLHRFRRAKSHTSFCNQQQHLSQWKRADHCH